MHCCDLHFRSWLFFLMLLRDNVCTRFLSKGLSCRKKYSKCQSASTVSIPKGKYSIRLMDAYHINRSSLPDSRIKLSAVDSEVCGLSRVSGTLLQEKHSCCWRQKSQRRMFRSWSSNSQHETTTSLSSSRGTRQLIKRGVTNARDNYTGSDRGKHPHNKTIM